MRRQKNKWILSATDKKRIIAIKESIAKIEEKIKKIEINDKQKDKFENFLDKIGDKIEDINDKKIISDNEATLLKERIGKVKNNLDMPKKILHSLIKKKIICHFVDQMTDEILEIIHDEDVFKEKITQGLYKNKEISKKISDLIKNKIAKLKKYEKL